MITLLVCGSRSVTNYSLVEGVLLGYPDASFISGGAIGADSLAERFAREHNKPIVVVPADWSTHGKSAGYIRNQQMIDMGPNMVIAFWDGVSKGTQHTIDLAKQKKITTLIIYTQG